MNVQAIAQAARKPMPTFVARYKIKGTDGQWYGGDMPSGVDSTGERSEPYYVQLTRQGTTIGCRYSSLEAAQQHFSDMEDAKQADFVSELISMPCEQLISQAKYWLRS